MTETPLPVSVVMPVYNGQAYLAEALDSVLAQTHRDFEIVVVDDGSTDESPAILAAYAARDPRVRPVRQPNGGISAALNTGLRAARGTWIARLDADDVMLPRRLERQLAFVAADPTLVGTGSDFALIDAGGTRRGEIAPLPRSRAELERFFAAREPLTFTHPTMLFRRDAALALGGYDAGYEPAEDAHLFSRMLAAGGTILIQPEVLTLYRVHGGSISSRSATRQYLKVRHIYRNFYAARDGRGTVTWDEFQAERAARPLRERLHERMMLASEHLYRRSTAARVSGRPGLAMAWLAAAAAFRPAKALRRGWRMVRRRLGATAGGPPAGQPAGAERAGAR